MKNSTNYSLPVRIHQGYQLASQRMSNAKYRHALNDSLAYDMGQILGVAGSKPTLELERDPGMI